jgi:hypothetical protein
MTAHGGRSEEYTVGDTGTGSGKVVVNRAMSLDGFIAAPGDEMGWVLEHMRTEQQFPEIMAATGASVTQAGPISILRFHVCK